MKNVDKFYLF